MSRPFRGQGGHLAFPIVPKNTNLVEDVDILLHIKFRWIRFSSLREVKNVSAYQRSGWPSYFSDRHKNANLVENVEILLPVNCRGISFSGFRGEVENLSANQTPARPSCFCRSTRKNTNFVEHADILLPIKFRWISFSSIIEVKNVSANQRSGWPSHFSNRHKNANLVENV